MRNEMEIKDDLYHLLKGSELMKSVSGKLSKTLRPDWSDKEDVVISLLTPAPNRQIEEVYINVNVYVADVKRGNQYEENTIRLRELMKLSEKALGRVLGNFYRLTLEEQKSFDVPGRNEHLINNKVLYQICNE